MKQFLFLLAIVCLLTSSCQSQQSKAIKDQQKAYEALKSQLPAGTVAAAEGSWTMTATIDGKPWKASYMYLPDAAGRINGHFNDEYIALPYPNDNMTAGHKITFEHGNATDLSVAGDDNFYAGYEGEMIITKVSGGWVEGTFHFVATSHGNARKINVTNGFFRIKMAK